MKDCFSDNILNILFKCDGNGCLLATESYDVEYKKSLHINSDLLITMNALANNKGGYIICGVEPTTRMMIGITDEKLEFYKQKIDTEEFRGKILSSCQPNIEYRHYLHNVGITKFVVFYIAEQTNKPHIFTNSYDQIKLGDIYFRYNDSVKKILYAELNAIIEMKRVKEQDKWMKFLGEIAKIGLDNVLIIDNKNGKIISSEIDDNGIQIDGELLSQFKLIQEGRFSEVNGDPTLKIIGNINLVNETNNFELTTQTTALLTPNVTHKYIVSKIITKLEEEGVETRDNIKITKKSVHYSRALYLIKNNNLDKGIENIYEFEVGNSYRKKYSNKVYDFVKETFSNMTLAEILAIKEIKKESIDNGTKD